MQLITPDQSRLARREFGLSQADVAEATGLKRQYLSEFESDTAQRFTASQLRKLRAFYEAKLAAAKDAGEEIDLDFGAATPEADQAVGSIDTVSAKRFHFPVDDSVPPNTLAKSLATIRANDKAVVDSLMMVADREDALLGSGDYTEAVQQAFRDAFSLLACNYLIIRSLGGWPEIGLSASADSLVGNTVLAAIVSSTQEKFEAAGLLTKATAANVDEDDEGGE